MIEGRKAIPSIAKTTKGRSFGEAQMSLRDDAFCIGVAKGQRARRIRSSEIIPAIANANIRDWPLAYVTRLRHSL